MITKVQIGERSLETDSLPLVKKRCKKGLKNSQKVIIDNVHIKDQEQLTTTLKQLKHEVIKQDDKIEVAFDNKGKSYSVKKGDS